MYNYSDAALWSTVIGLISTICLFVLALIVLKLVANWKIFTKAGQPGWASIVPFYNSYIQYKIYWGNGWVFLVPLVLSLLGFIPVIGSLLLIVSAIIGIITQYKKAVAFGQGAGFAIGLVLLGTIFNLILAFGQYEYHGVPQDGYSYDQLRAKYDNRQQSTTYTAPDQGHEENDDQNH